MGKPGGNGLSGG